MRIRSSLTALACAGCLLTSYSLAAATPEWVVKGPLPRRLHSAVFDPTTDEMIVFGGRAISASASSLNDLWKLSYAAVPGGLLYWTNVIATGTPPAPRVGHTAVYDAITNRMVVFGGGLGSTSPCANEVWVLENANGTGGTPTWTPLTTTGAAPSPRINHTAVYDPITHNMIVFGGGNCFSTAFNDVWVLSNADGLGGTPVWTQLSPSGTPPVPRLYHTAVYDSSSNRMTIFAGGSPGGDLNDTWVLTNANGQGGTPAWVQLSPSGTLPAPRDSHSAVYDPATNRMTIFGGGVAAGLTNAALTNETWVLSHADGTGGTPVWKQLGPFVTTPFPRENHTAVYRSTSNTMTVFGGLLNLTETLDTNDVFVLRDANGE